MIDYTQMVRPHIRQMPAYEPILPFEVLSQQLGLPAGSIIKLDANENPYGPLPDAQQALAELAYPHIYPDPESRFLRRALSAYHTIPVENLIVGAGADELIDLLMRALVEPGEAIINCLPTFGMYAFDGDIHRAQLISIPRQADFGLDIGGIETAAYAQPVKLIFLASPNNPDGSLAPPEILERLLALPLIVALDEAYIEFAPAGSSSLHAVLQRDNLVVLRTFSKWAGLAGLRIGYGAFPGWMAPHLWKIKQPYNVSAAASQAAIASIQNADQLEKTGQAIVNERQRLFQLLDEIPWLRPYPSQANFILCQVVGRSAASLKASLARKGILVRYFDKPGLSDHIRISVGKPAHTGALIAALLEME